MKKFLVFGIIALFASFSLAHITQDEEYILNQQMGPAAHKARLGTLVNKTKNLLVAKYSYAVQGGSTSAEISLITDLRDAKSYAKLPDNAVVVNGWLEILTAPVAIGDTATTNFSIAGNVGKSADIFASTAGTLLTAGRFIQGVQTGATTTFLKMSVSGGSVVKMNIASANGTSGLTAGKWNLYLEYMLGD